MNERATLKVWQWTSRSNNDHQRNAAPPSEKNPHTDLERNAPQTLHDLLPNLPTDLLIDSRFIRVYGDSPKWSKILSRVYSCVVVVLAALFLFVGSVGLYGYSGIEASTSECTYTVTGPGIGCMQDMGSRLLTLQTDFSANLKSHHARQQGSLEFINTTLTSISFTLNTSLVNTAQIHALILAGELEQAKSYLEQVLGEDQQVDFTALMHSIDSVVAKVAEMETELEVWEAYVSDVEGQVWEIIKELTCTSESFKNTACGLGRKGGKMGMNEVFDVKCTQRHGEGVLAVI